MTILSTSYCEADEHFELYKRAELRLVGLELDFPQVSIAVLGTYRG